MMPVAGRAPLAGLRRRRPASLPPATRAALRGTAQGTTGTVMTWPTRTSPSPITSWAS